MIAVIQRVLSAKVVVENSCVAEINQGALVLLAIESQDTKESVHKLSKKICHLRMFSDAKNKMNLSLLDKGNDLLIVSQFTLAADFTSGNRPSFTGAAKPTEANILYEYFIQHTQQHYTQCKHGIFGADMKVHIINDGPVTFTLKI